MRKPFGFLLITLCLTFSPLEAAVPLGFPSFRGYDNNNNLLVGGKVYSYQGGTSTPKNTYSDPALAIPNPNPLVLDSRGEALIYLDPHSSTKLVLQDAQSNVIRTWDNLIWGGLGLINSLMPQQFGAKGDGLADDTAALNAAVAAAPVGGVIYLPPGTYKTTGWLINKTVSLIADTPFLYGSGSQAATVKAAGSQDYILKFQGTFSADASSFLHPRLRNVNIDGGNQTITDAAFIMEYCHLSHVEGCSFQNVKGRGVRLRTVWEMRLRDFFISNCGTINTGSAFAIDGPKPFDYAQGCSDVSISGGIWSSNRGRWLEVSAQANLDGCWIKDNKFELDQVSTPNSLPTDVLHFDALSRSMIINNTFAGFGQKSGNYANLISINGDPRLPPTGWRKCDSGESGLWLSGQRRHRRLIPRHRRPLVKEGRQYLHH